MGRTMKKIAWTFLGLIVVFALYEAFLFLQIDSCLDRGGAWDYPKKECVLEGNMSIKKMECLSKRGTWNLKGQFCE